MGGFKTKKEAELACAELITQIEKNEYIEPSKLTFGEFLKDFMENHVRLTIRQSTYESQISVINKHIYPGLGHLELQKITPMIIQKFYSNKLREGLSASYIRIMHAIISKTLKTATEWELISKNVSTLLKPPRVENNDVEVWTMTEITQFLSLTKNRKFYIAYALAIFTGMRKGEILGLRWRDCDLDKGQIRIRQTLYKVKGALTFQEPKTRKSKRSISISETVISILKKHRAAQNELKLKLGNAYRDHDLVVANYNGNPVDLGDINRDLKYVISKYNLPKIKFHGLRHTHATLLLQLGENPKVVSERLGHAEVGITLNTYSHVLPDMQKSLADNFENAIQIENASIDKKGKIL
ncbi:site-specific integrase [Shimazuella sp. AN120528]|nr:site-specific integrase [Shimazuella soli]